MEERPYHSHTECDTRYARIKCLDFIVDAVTRVEEERCRKLRILEIGCGNGNISLPLASLGHSIFSTDVDLSSVRVAKTKNPFPNARFFVSDGETSFGKGRFDIVLASEVLEHVEAPERLVSVCKELIDPQGLLILTVPNGYGPCELAISGLGLSGKLLKGMGLHRLLASIKENFFAGAKQESYISSNPESRHVQRFTVKRIREILSAGNFRIETLAHSDFVTPVVELAWRFKLPDRVHYADWWLADRLPHSMVSGWYFLCKAV
jgi:2-polyprenyl-3-methyl-5-hydroxy-6-metoxy-1,4-benzoquinol methylase